MDTAALEKQRLREERLAAREALSEQERSVLDDRITQKLLATSEYAEATTVLTYISVSSEVSKIFESEYSPNTTSCSSFSNKVSGTETCCLDSR